MDRKSFPDQNQNPRQFLVSETESEVEEIDQFDCLGVSSEKHERNLGSFERIGKKIEGETLPQQRTTNQKSINIIKKEKNDPIIIDDETSFLSFRGGDPEERVINSVFNNNKNASPNRENAKYRLNNDFQNNHQNSNSPQRHNPNPSYNPNAPSNGNEFNNPNVSPNRHRIDHAMSIPLDPSVSIPPFFTFNFNGIPVRFPHQTMYEAQKEVIHYSLLSFSKGQNALLESPTGTGKTLALLSASLSFLEKNPQITRIFYASRTHIQLTQMVRELKRLAYFPNFAILASRKHLCIFDPVAKSENPENECRKCCDPNSEVICPYHVNVNSLPDGDIENIDPRPGAALPKGCNAVPREFTNQGKNPKFTIDDLKNYGRKNRTCPYKLAQSIYVNSKLVFCPYNYILTPNDDKSLLLDFPKNSCIVIFDEGHNIESTNRENASLSITYKLALDTNKAAMNAFYDPSNKQLFNNIALLTNDIMLFIRNMHADIINKYRDKSIELRPKYIQASFNTVFAQTKKSGISLASLGNQMYTYSQYVFSKNFNEGKPSNERENYWFETVLHFCTYTCDVFGVLTQANYDSFRIAYVPHESNNIDLDEIRFLCMRPALLFEKINSKARSIIIASGTLSPLESFAAELEANFPIQISAKHIVDPSQVLTISISSHNNVKITSKFRELQKDSQSIYSALSEIVQSTLTSVPGGSLFFTPSYKSKEQIIKCWHRLNTYNKICAIKPIVEEKSNLNANEIIKEFQKYKDGALLIGVHRGKMSEGLDFAGDLARMVYVFGIPYPNLVDADVELKKKFNESRHSTYKKYLSGNDWYNCQAFRALFQSVGRCIRNKDDYSAIIFLDDRIDSHLKEFPVWIKEGFHSSQTLVETIDLLNAFYSKMKKLYANRPSLAQPPSFGLPTGGFEKESQPQSFVYINDAKNKNTFNSGNNSYQFYNMNSNRAEDVKTFRIPNGADPNNSYLTFRCEGSVSGKNLYVVNDSSQDSEIFDKSTKSSSSGIYTANTPFSVKKDEIKPSNQTTANSAFPGNFGQNSPSYSTHNESRNLSQTTKSPSRNYNTNSAFSRSPGRPSFSPGTFINSSKASNNISSISINDSHLSKITPSISVNTEACNQTDAKKISHSFPVKVENSATDVLDDDFIEDNEVKPTNMFCSSCSALVMRIKYLNRVDFKVISVPEFFSVLDLNSQEKNRVMFLMKNNINNNFMKDNKKRVVWSALGNCVMKRYECPRCGIPLAVEIVSTKSDSCFKQGEFLFRMMLSMKHNGKIRPLSEIACD